MSFRIFAVSIILFTRCADAFLPMSKTSLREYEKKHGRVAIASLATLGALSASGVDEPVKWLSQQPISDQLTFFSTAGVLEAAATLPRFQGLLQLREEVQPGKFFNATVNDNIDMAEDVLGRVAMLYAFAMLVNTLL